MKKRILLTLLIFGVLIMIIFGFYKYNHKQEKALTTLKVAEVAHSIFYAPFYVALENGYFEQEGLNVELMLTPGADKVSAAVLSGDVQVGFCGPESSIYVYKGNEKDYIQTFAGLTKRDGQFIVSRKKIKDFKMTDLVGKEVLAGRAGGMPVLNFENALNNSKIDPSKVNINTSVEFAALSGTFIGGEGDFVNLFEPNATKLENEGFGYVVASVGQASGEVPYTAFNAKKSYINKNEEVLKKFTKAIKKGLTFVKNNDEEKIANAILKQFPDTSLNDSTKIIARYKKADSWLSSPFISEKSFVNLENIMIDAKLLDDYVPYNKLIHNIYE